MLALDSQKLIIIGILFGIFIFVLIDILKSEFCGYNKNIWILLVVFLSDLRTILYLLIGRKLQQQRDQN